MEWYSRRSGSASWRGARSARPPAASGSPATVPTYVRYVTLYYTYILPVYSAQCSHGGRVVYTIPYKYYMSKLNCCIIPKSLAKYGDYSKLTVIKYTFVQQWIMTTNK